ncbi:nicotinate-nucleotide pyrophosphorylase [carboxylating] [Chitinophaga costaii]|uniref:Probable nicotinate-nucleotide pyrophosphorylase [carboxylating] n=1 Tax=Chitinophaga costaii TaxID=1335309 RepID=A0A1C4B4G9_9BACT|nr:carboxylating nicotinate-nucleotide diphosphorylase [Chitinophaga costaii]PUZ26861.1 carboxylating nicotinate-nucleotide diphosphorylase [Chitinophaga costaii]SCC01638.1 nicotinate-nucleotide pyrophosphorylase [carboxylating] [Chitinophaga costaii]
MALDTIALSAFITSALAEDVGSGDHSTLACIPANAEGKAQLKIKEAGILAGMEVAEAIFRHLEPATVFTALKKDGEPMQAGEVAFTVAAHVHTLLTAERLVLNCMQRMSGIATLTHQYVQLLQPYHSRILDTRKTTPNFRLLEKEAVRIGGGINHRMGLYDMIMLKDNHIDFAGGIPAAVARTVDYLKAHDLHLRIEVETRNLTDVEQALATGKVDRIMLDNYTTDQLRAALELIQGKVETEASGGITLENIVSYAQTGVDYISAGAIIHHAVSLDLSLKAL